MPRCGDNDPVQLITTPGRWTVVVPLKSSARAKSRIDVDPELRRALARAMALDTVEAAAGAPDVGGVLVVADDAEDVRPLLRIPGVRSLLTATAGLNEAIREGLRPLPDQARVAVLPGDLPSLTSAELQGALAAAARHEFAVVADRQGTGTTLLAASSARRLYPRYGGGSLARHVAAGAVPLEVPVGSGLRRDVDGAVDLADVTGARTLAVLAEAACPTGLCAARTTG
jgi:2-phospho-L-lactate guanylyltransferase